jgi:hypothetical protein
MIWKTFGPVSTDTSIHRPFGKAVVDGFDFDFESTVTHMPSFGNELRRLFTQDTSKTYYLTAAPQCVYPDAADNPMLDGAVYFDAIWVQFYNNDCGIDHFMANSMTQTNFNFASWNTWATTISQNKDVKCLAWDTRWQHRGRHGIRIGIQCRSDCRLYCQQGIQKLWRRYGLGCQRSVRKLWILDQHCILFTISLYLHSAEH